MRIDKYLWCVRYYKTRTIATQACKKGAVKISEKSVKPSRDVYPGDTLEAVSYTHLTLPTNREV